MYQKAKAIKVDQDLYITNNDIIEVNNKVLHQNSILTVLKIKDNYLEVSELSSINVNKNVCEKIIASSNIELGLPQIPQSFIDMNQLGDILVEYKNRCCGRCDRVHDLCVTDMICNDHHLNGCEVCYGIRGNQLSLVDNTINIKLIIMDLKEEFEKCKSNPYYFYTKYCQVAGQPATTKLSEADFNQWILQNFK